MVGAESNSGFAHFFDINGGRWGPMGSNGGQWGPMGANGSQWRLMGINGGQWGPTGANGDQRVPMGPMGATGSMEANGSQCVWETPYRETTVFRSHDPKYYTTSDWLAPGQIFQTCHTGRPLCLGNAIQGDHCVPIP